MLIIEIAIGVLLFVVGYVLGRLNLIQKALRNPEEVEFLGKPRQSAGWKLHSQEQHPQNKPMRIVDIDERKFVTAVDTDSFKGKSKNLGNKTVTKDKVSSSVSKLKKLKGE